MLKQGQPGVKQNYEQAVRWSEMAASPEIITAHQPFGTSFFTESQEWHADEHPNQVRDSPHIAASYEAGVAYMTDGTPVQKDYSKALNYLQAAHDQGYPDASYDLGIMLVRGYGVGRNLPLALKYFQEADQFRNPKAACAIGKLHALGHGIDTQTNQYELAVKYFEKGYILGDHEASLELGKMYMLGCTGKPILSKALFYLMDAHEYHVLGADFELGKMMLYGFACWSNDPKNGRERILARYEDRAFTPTRIQNQGEERFTLNRDKTLLESARYQHAINFFFAAAKQFPETKIYAVAMKYLKLADYRGLPNFLSIYRDNPELEKTFPELTDLKTYFPAMGEPSNPQKRKLKASLKAMDTYPWAISYYRAHHPYHLIEIPHRARYQNEFGVDYSKEQQHYTAAASKNDANASYQLGLLYLQGHGVEKDMIQCVSHFTKAADLGNTKAKEMLEQLNKQNGEGILLSMLEHRVGRSAPQWHSVKNIKLPLESVKLLFFLEIKSLLGNSNVIKA